MNHCRTLGFVLLLTSATAVAGAAFALQDDSAFRMAFDRAEAHLQRGKYKEAIKDFERANKLAGKKSAAGYLGIARAHFAQGKYNDARKNSERALKHATEDGHRLTAHLLHGDALARDPKAGEKKLRQAEKSYRAAADAVPDSPDAHFKLGWVLLRLDKIDAGKASLQRYLELYPEGERAFRARALLDKPEQAKLEPAPLFALTTTSGGVFSLYQQRGKVVVIDFWATWCGPCQVTVPYLRTLSETLSPQTFTIISISADRDVRAWRTYIKKERMTWNQHRDTSRRLQRLFKVQAFPTFFVLDSDGMIRGHIQGWGGTAAYLLRTAINLSLIDLADQLGAEVSDPSR